MFLQSEIALSMASLVHFVRTETLITYDELATGWRQAFLVHYRVNTVTEFWWERQYKTTQNWRTLSNAHNSGVSPLVEYSRLCLTFATSAHMFVLLNF